MQTNTFQGIVVTNGFQSFAVFTYRCGSMQWSGDAMVGFKAISRLSRIHQLSGANASSIACQNSPRNVWSNVVYQLRKSNTSCFIASTLLFSSRLAGDTISSHWWKQDLPVIGDRGWHFWSSYDSSRISFWEPHPNICICTLIYM